MPTLTGLKLFWRDGRFSWPFVVVAAYLALAVFLFDLAWRLTQSSIESLLMTAAAVFAVSSVVLALAIRAFSRRASGYAPARKP